MEKMSANAASAPDLGLYREMLRTYVERISNKYQAKFDESDKGSQEN